MGRPFSTSKSQRSARRAAFFFFFKFVSSKRNFVTNRVVAKSKTQSTLFKRGLPVEKRSKEKNETSAGVGTTTASTRRRYHAGASPPTRSPLSIFFPLLFGQSVAAYCQVFTALNRALTGTNFTFNTKKSVFIYFKFVFCVSNSVEKKKKTKKS